MNCPAGAFEIVLSILGPRSNLYLLDQDGVLLYAMRPLAATRRELVLGSAWKDPEGSPRSEGTDRWASVPDGEYLEAVEATYAALERTLEAETLARRLEQAFQKEADFLERKAVNMLQDLGEAMQAEEYRHKGELLKLALHSIRTGDESVTVDRLSIRKTGGHMHWIPGCRRPKTWPPISSAIKRNSAGPTRCASNCRS